MKKENPYVFDSKYSLSKELVNWYELGSYTSINGINIFFIDTNLLSGTKGSFSEEDSIKKETIVFFHGFPMSSYDFKYVFEKLKTHYRIVIFDFPGYGFSEKPSNYSYSLFEQADIALQLCQQLKISKIHLISYDMGTSVAAEWIARYIRSILPISISSLTLMNGSVYINLAKLTVAQKLLLSPIATSMKYFTNFIIFSKQIKRIMGKEIDNNEIIDMWTLLNINDGVSMLPRINSYLLERTRFHNRWTGALKAVDIPTLILWGGKDPVAVTKIAEQLKLDIKTSRLVTNSDIGHCPQLEDPNWVYRELYNFLSNLSNKD